MGLGVEVMQARIIIWHDARARASLANIVSDP
jgi:hypothetical protein